MTAPDPAAGIVEAAAKAAPGLLHVTVCHDDNLALCGADVTFEPWGPVPGEQNCIVCHDIEDTLDCTDECVCPCCVRSLAEGLGDE